MLRKSFIIFILFSLLGCADSLFEQIATNNVVPEDSKKPVVKSFDVQDAIVIVWEGDIGADEYILYRAQSNPFSSYTLIYKGDKLTYTDYVGGFDEGTFFYYKIAKKRESKEFDKSSYTMGVVSRHIKDSFEDNDSAVSAYNIDNIDSLSLKIFFARDTYDNEVVDTDYFKVKIPANRYYQYQCSLVDNLTTNNIIINAYEEDFEFTSTANLSFYVYNRSNSENYKTFYIRVDKTHFFGTPSAAGFRTGFYKIQFQLSNPIL